MPHPKSIKLLKSSVTAQNKAIVMCPVCKGASYVTFLLPDGSYHAEDCNNCYGGIVLNENCATIEPIKQEVKQ